MNRKRVARTVLSRLGMMIILLASVQPACAWHGKGHVRATRLAIRLLPEDVPEFFRHGAAMIAHCSVDPDIFTRPMAPDALHKTESPEHYFDLKRLDGLDIPSNRYDLLKWCAGKDIAPSRVGLVPYAIAEWTQRLTVVFAEHRKWPANPHIRMKALMYAGIQAHYAEDLCMPLHTTIHYDGRAKPDGSSPKSGIHLKVDALLGKLPAALEVQADAAAVQPFKELFPRVVGQLKASYALVEPLYKLESKLPAYKDPLKADGPVAAFAVDRLKASAVFAARLMLTAWRDSARIKLPEWHDRPAGPGDAVTVVTPPSQAQPTSADKQTPASHPAGEELRVATYNIEHFMRMFDQEQMPDRSRNLTELFRDDEDLYEVARTLRLERMNAHVVAIQECCSQGLLERFNERRLGGQYAFVKVFAGNVAGQYLAILAKPGIEPLEVRDQYHLEADSVDDPQLRRVKERAGLAAKNLLFSRGPAFVKFKTPGGNVLWIGVTHAKSKYGNSPAVTKWRIRELKRTRQICAELIAKGGTDHLLLCGDFNDDFGMDDVERTVGADALAAMLEGDASQKLVCVTRPLVLANPQLASYHCEIKPARYRSFIDHVFASQATAKLVRQVYLADDPIAAVASDHFPVVTVLRFGE